MLPDGRALEYWDGGDPGGRGVLFHPGTPAARMFGRWGHEAAAASGLRLVAVSRPGYGGSTPITTVPSLLGTGRDTAELAAHLGLADYAVLGISGGGPFAVATAVADPGSVRAVAVVGPVGPWRDLDEPTDKDSEDRGFLAQLDAGDLAAARAGLHRAAEREMGRWRALDDDAIVDAILAPDTDTPLARDAEYRAIWAVNMAQVLDGFDGYVFDNLAWGGVWDVDAADVIAPTVVWDADGEGASHGRWYAERIADSELVIFPGDGHLDVCDAHWPEVVAGLLRIWP